MQFYNSHDFAYSKQGINKIARLRTTYYVNSQYHFERLIYCSLNIISDNKSYSFFYDPNKNITYLYNETYQEELFFTEDLQNQINALCKEDQVMFDTKYQLMTMAVHELYKALGKTDTNWAKEEEATVHIIGPEAEYVPKLNPNIPEEYFENVLFGNNNADAVFPLIDYYKEAWADDLYIVVKDGFMGIINGQGSLVVPYEAVTIPSASEGDLDSIHIHYWTNDQDNLTARLIPNTIYHICRGGHGSSSYEYYYIEDTQELIKVTQGHDGPKMINNIEKEKLNSKLNLYQSLYLYTEEKGNMTTFYDGRKLGPGLNTLKDEDYVSFSKTGKYGVFSESGKVSDAIYDDGIAINSDLVAVRKDGLWGYVDSNGVEVVPCEYQTVYTNIYEDRVSEYIYLALNNSIVVKNTAGFFGVLDYQGNTLVDFTYEWISPFTDGNVLIKTNNEWHIMDPFTQQILK